MTDTDRLDKITTLTAHLASVAPDNDPPPRSAIDQIAAWLIFLRRRRKPSWKAARSALITELWRIAPGGHFGGCGRTLWGNVWTVRFVLVHTSRGDVWRTEIW